MLKFSFLLVALAAYVHSAPASQPAIFGAAYPPPEQGGYLPASTSYSNGPYKQTVFISFDGLHQFDVVDYIAKFPNSTWASIVKNAVVYSNARASSPSDSLPATAALFAGASPRNSGIFWETSFDRSLYPPGSNCKGPVGAICDYSEAPDLDLTRLDGGGGFNLSLLPLQKTSWGSCEVVYPHNYIRVNTMFEVGRANGIVTAYADKHPSYEFLNGPSGTGLSQGYFPEIASIDSSLAAEEAFDDLHWSALRNWTNGNWANGTKNPSGAPSLYGSNFQTITWAQQKAGYLDPNGNQPNKSLESALTEADSRLGNFLNFLQSTGKLNSTLVMIGSKQGQGPINPKTLKVSNPDFMQDDTGVPVQFFVGEDGGVLWLENSSDAQKAKSKLLANSSLGLSYVLAGDEIVAAGYGDPFLDPRVPDLILGAKVGTLWNSGFEFEDHGGFLPQDLNVPLIAYNPNLKPANITQVVSTRQVASTMLQALGLPLAQLDGYRLGDSPVLPGLFT